MEDYGIHMIRWISSIGILITIANTVTSRVNVAATYINISHYLIQLKCYHHDLFDHRNSHHLYGRTAHNHHLQNLQCHHYQQGYPSSPTT